MNATLLTSEERLVVSLMTDALQTSGLVYVLVVSGRAGDGDLFSNLVSSNDIQSVLRQIAGMDLDALQVKPH